MFKFNILRAWFHKLIQQERASHIVHIPGKASKVKTLQERGAYSGGDGEENFEVGEAFQSEQQHYRSKK